MTADPWNRPTMDDLRQILENIQKLDQDNVRSAERLELSVPAEMITTRGSTVPCMTREVSRTGIGLLHRGAVQPGEVTVRIASDSREFEYRVLIEWCQPCEKGMFLSGGQFLSKPQG